jgi:cell division ATPase FtsA
MTTRNIRAFDYVNHPYEAVRDALSADIGGIFQRATKVAEERRDELVAALEVSIGGLQVSKDVTIQVGAIREQGAVHARVTHVELAWQAAAQPALFPMMKADLRIYGLSPTETQIDLSGEYEPPLGLLGSAIDAVVGHRLAEASVHRFVRAVVERLRHDIKRSTLAPEGNAEQYRPLHGNNGAWFRAVRLRPASTYEQRSSAGPLQSQRPRCTEARGSRSKPSENRRILPAPRDPGVRSVFQ